MQNQSIESPSARYTLKSAERLLLRRERALGKLGADLSIKRKDGLVFGASTAAGMLGISVASFKTMLDPFDTVTNPHHKSGPPVALYDPIDLLRLSKQKRVEKARSRCGPKRQVAAKKAAKARRAKAEMEANEIVDAWDIKLPNMDWPTIVSKAIESYITICINNGHLYNKRRTQEDTRGLVLNYLRHECSDYDYILFKVASSIRGKIARDVYFETDPVSHARRLMHDAIEGAASAKWQEFNNLPECASINTSSPSSVCGVAQ